MNNLNVDNEKIEYLIKKAAFDNNKTLVEITTAATGMSHASFRNKVTNRKKWYFDELWRISQYFDLEINDLLLKEEV